MSAAERKKAKMLARKAKAKQEKQLAAAASVVDLAGAEEKDENDKDAADKEEKKSKFPPPPAAPTDPDPLGLVYLKALVPDTEDDANSKGAAAAAVAASPSATAVATPLKKTTALAEAQRAVTNLLKFAPSSLTSQWAAFDVACRRGKLLLALRALLHAKAVSPEDPNTLMRMAAFALGCKASGVYSASAAGSAATSAAVVAAPEGATPATKGLFVCAAQVCVAGRAMSSAVGGDGNPAKEVLVSELEALVPSIASSKGEDAVGAVVSAFANKHAKTSLPHAVACARSAVLVAAYSSDKKSSTALLTVAAEYVTKEGPLPGLRSGCTVGACEEALAVLTADLSAAASAAAAWKKACAEAWPLSSAFGTPQRPLPGDSSALSVAGGAEGPWEGEGNDSGTDAKAGP
jgi:hypothetical protein